MSSERQRTPPHVYTSNRFINLLLQDDRTLTVSRDEDPTTMARRVVAEEAGLGENDVPRVAERIQDALRKDTFGSRENSTNAVQNAMATIQAQGPDVERNETSDRSTRAEEGKGLSQPYEAGSHTDDNHDMSSLDEELKSKHSSNDVGYNDENRNTVEPNSSNENFSGAIFQDIAPTPHMIDQPYYTGLSSANSKKRRSSSGDIRFSNQSTTPTKSRVTLRDDQGIKSSPGIAPEIHSLWYSNEGNQVPAATGTGTLDAQRGSGRNPSKDERVKSLRSTQRQSSTPNTFAGQMRPQDKNVASVRKSHRRSSSESVPHLKQRSRSTATDHLWVAERSNAIMSPTTSSRSPHSPGKAYAKGSTTPLSGMRPRCRTEYSSTSKKSTEAGSPVVFQFDRHGDSPHTKDDHDKSVSHSTMIGRLPTSEHNSAWSVAEYSSSILSKHEAPMPTANSTAVSSGEGTGVTDLPSHSAQGQENIDSMWAFRRPGSVKETVPAAVSESKGETKEIGSGQNSSGGVYPQQMSSEITPTTSNENATASINTTVDIADPQQSETPARQEINVSSYSATACMDSETSVNTDVSVVSHSEIPRAESALSKSSAMDEESRESYYNAQMRRSTSRHHRRAVRCVSRSTWQRQRHPSRESTRSTHSRTSESLSNVEPEVQKSHGLRLDDSVQSAKNARAHGSSARGKAASSRLSPSDLKLPTNRDEHRNPARAPIQKPAERDKYGYSHPTEVSRLRISKKSVSVGQRLYEQGTELLKHRHSLGKQDLTIEEATAVRPVTPRSVRTGARLYTEGLDLRKQRDEHAAKVKAAEEAEEDWICPECSQWCHPDDEFCKRPCKYGRVLWNQRNHRVLHHQGSHEITGSEQADETSKAHSAEVQHVLEEFRNSPESSEWLRVCGTERPPHFHVSSESLKFPLKKMSKSIQRYVEVKKEREEAEEKRQALQEMDSDSCTFQPHLSKRTESLALQRRGKCQHSIGSEAQGGEDVDSKQLTEYQDRSIFQRLYEEKPERFRFDGKDMNVSTLHRRLTEAMREEVHRRLYSEAEKMNQKYSRLLETATKSDPFTGERFFNPSTLPLPKHYRRQKHNEDIHEHLYTSGKIHKQKLSELQQKEQEEKDYEMTRSKVLPRSSKLLRKMRERTTNHLFVLLHRTTQLSDKDKALIEDLEHNPSAVSVESATRIIDVLSGMTAPPTAAEIKEYVPKPVPIRRAWISILAEPLPSFLRETIDEALGGMEPTQTEASDSDQEETLSYSCLHDALHTLLQRMDTSRILYDSYLRPPAYSIFRGSIRTWKKNDHGAQDDTTFEPQTDPHSRKLAMSTRDKSADADVHERLYSYHIQHEENIQKIRDSLEEQWRSEHPFRPALNKAPTYLKTRTSTYSPPAAQQTRSTTQNATAGEQHTLPPKQHSNQRSETTGAGDTDISFRTDVATITSGSSTPRGGQREASGTQDRERDSVSIADDAPTSGALSSSSKSEFLNDLSFDELMLPTT